MISTSRTFQLPDDDLVVDFDNRVRQSHHDAGKNDQRHAVSDAAFGNLLTQPHDECGAGGERDHRQQDEPDPGIGDQSRPASGCATAIPADCTRDNSTVRYRV